MSSYDIFYSLKRQAKKGEIKTVPQMSKKMLANVSKRIDKEVDRIMWVFDNNRMTADEFTEAMKVVERMLNAI